MAKREREKRRYIYGGIIDDDISNNYADGEGPLILIDISLKEVTQ